MTSCVSLALAAMLSATHDGRFDREIDAAIASTAYVYPVPRVLVLAIIRAESDFDPRAVSRAGAIGLMQVMPVTARKVGVDPAELLDPRRNVLAGVRLLAVLLRYYRGDVVDVLVAYNAGPRLGGVTIPRNGETGPYLLRVLSAAARSSDLIHSRTASGRCPARGASGGVSATASSLGR